MNSAAPRQPRCASRVGPVARVALALGLACGVAVGAGAAASPEVDVLLRDFDRDGTEERLVARPGAAWIERWNADAGTWEKADFSLPDGVLRLDEDGRDAGLRWVDLNGDGFDDILYSNRNRYAIHLWNTEVQPHLGWVRGWSHVVKAGARRGDDREPPPLEEAEVRVVGEDVVIRRVPTVGEAAGVERRPRRTLTAFDVPPPRSPEEALATMQVPAGFRVELVAAEPVVLDPVYFDWDDAGRLWVVEMRDYPNGMDGRGQPGGVVKVLSDRDGDGRYETMIPFLEGLPFPTSVLPWRRGALVAMAPDLVFAEDTDGDGRADRRQVVLTGFVPGNQQHRFNGFEWGLDGWIHAANGDSGGEVHSARSGTSISIRGRDLRFRPDTGEVETVSAQTQYGRRRDDWGNWFGNNNPTWLWHVTVPEHYLRRNPRVAVKRVTHVLANYEDSTRVYPASPAMVRPNQPWALNHVTSACSPSPYRDDLFGAAFATSVFICEPVHNAVHREVLERQGAGFLSRRAVGEETREFLASTDNWFRPTTVKTGPEGALYVADMYRLVIEHPEWISREMQSRLDLRAGEDKGRLYRIIPDGVPRRPIPDLSRLEGRDLVGAMNSPSGWQRDRVQQLLLERRPPEAGAGLASMLSLTHAPQVRLQALATLGLLGVLTPDALLHSLRDPQVWVRVEALRQSEAFAHGAAAGEVLRAVAALTTDGDAAVRQQAAYSLGAWPARDGEPLLESMAARDGDDEGLRTAILTSLSPDSPLFARLNSAAPVRVTAATTPALVASSTNRAAVITTYAGVEALAGDPASGRALFNGLCAPCHRLRGEGNEVGADLGMVGSKPTDWLLLAILDPSAAIDARYQAWSARLRSGEEWDGLVAAETANNLVLRMAGGIEHAILRSDLEALEPLKTSLMPEGFESALTPQGMADLLRWLRGP